MRARVAVALTTSALLAVAGCSSGGSTDAGATGSPATSSSPRATGSTPTGSASPTSGSTSPSGSAAPTATATASGPHGAVTPERAARGATRALTAAHQAVRQKGKAAERSRSSALVGPALEAAKGDARVAKHRGQSPPDPALNPVRANVLAITRAPGRPVYLVVQTQPSSGGNPVLHLMRASAPGKRFRIQASAPMLPGTSIDSFAPLEDGSPIVSNVGTGGPGRASLDDLAVKPQTLLADYTRYLRYPRQDVDDRPFASDPFATSVRKAASDQAEEVTVQADFSQTHKVLGDSVVTVRQPDGGALVFAALERKDKFSIKPGQTIKPTEAFQVYAPEQQKIELWAHLTTVEFLVFQVPPASGDAKLVAASEHLVGADGH